MEFKLTDLGIGEAPVVARAKLDLHQEINSNVRVLHKWATMYVGQKPGYLPRFVWRWILRKALIIDVTGFDKVKVLR